MAYLPDSAGLYDSVLTSISFQWVDYLLVTLSLWDIAIRVLLSSHRGRQEEEVVLGWLEQLNDVAIKSVLYQFLLISFFGILVDIYVRTIDILELQDPRVGLFWLAIGYFSFAFIRWFTVSSQMRGISPLDIWLRKTLEKDLHERFKEHGIREKSANIDENK
jgi:hypothetical protein